MKSFLTRPCHFLQDKRSSYLGNKSQSPVLHTNEEFLLSTKKIPDPSVNQSSYKDITSPDITLADLETSEPVLWSSLPMEDAILTVKETEIITSQLSLFSHSETPVMPTASIARILYKSEIKKSQNFLNLTEYVQTQSYKHLQTVDTTLLTFLNSHFTENQSLTPNSQTSISEMNTLTNSEVETLNPYFTQSRIESSQKNKIYFGTLYIDTVLPTSFTQKLHFNTLKNTEFLGLQSYTVTDTESLSLQSYTVIDSEFLRLQSYTVTGPDILPVQSYTVTDTESLLLQSYTVTDTESVARHSYAVTDTESLPLLHYTVTYIDFLPLQSLAVIDTESLGLQSYTSYSVTDTESLGLQSYTVIDTESLGLQSYTVTDTESLGLQSYTVTNTESLGLQSYTVTDASSFHLQSFTFSETNSLPLQSYTVTKTESLQLHNFTITETGSLPLQRFTISNFDSSLQQSFTITKKNSLLPLSSLVTETESLPLQSLTVREIDSLALQSFTFKEVESLPIQIYTVSGTDSLQFQSLKISETNFLPLQTYTMTETDSLPLSAIVSEEKLYSSIAKPSVKIITDSLAGSSLSLESSSPFKTTNFFPNDHASLETDSPLLEAYSLRETAIASPRQSEASLGTKSPIFEIFTSTVEKSQIFEPVTTEGFILVKSIRFSSDSLNNVASETQLFGSCSEEASHVSDSESYTLISKHLISSVKDINMLTPSDLLLDTVQFAIDPITYSATKQSHLNSFAGTITNSIYPTSVTYYQTGSQLLSDLQVSLFMNSNRSQETNLYEAENTLSKDVTAASLIADSVTDSTTNSSALGTFILKASTQESSSLLLNSSIETLQMTKIDSTNVYVPSLTNYLPNNNSTDLRLHRGLMTDSLTISVETLSLQESNPIDTISLNDLTSRFMTEAVKVNEDNFTATLGFFLDFNLTISEAAIFSASKTSVDISATTVSPFKVTDDTSPYRSDRFTDTVQTSNPFTLSPETESEDSRSKFHITLETSFSIFSTLSIEPLTIISSGTPPLQLDTGTLSFASSVKHTVSRPDFTQSRSDHSLQVSASEFRTDFRSLIDQTNTFLHEKRTTAFYNRGDISIISSNDIFYSNFVSTTTERISDNITRDFESLISQSSLYLSRTLQSDSVHITRNSMFDSQLVDFPKSLIHSSSLSGDLLSNPGASASQILLNINFSSTTSAVSTNVSPTMISTQSLFTSASRTHFTGAIFTSKQMVEYSSSPSATKPLNHFTATTSPTVPYLHMTPTLMSYLFTVPTQEPFSPIFTTNTNSFSFFVGTESATALTSLGADLFPSSSFDNITIDTSTTATTVSISNSSVSSSSSSDNRSEETTPTERVDALSTLPSLSTSSLFASGFESANVSLEFQHSETSELSEMLSTMTFSDSPMNMSAPVDDNSSLVLNTSTTKSSTSRFEASSELSSIGSEASSEFSATSYVMPSELFTMVSIVPSDLSFMSSEATDSYSSQMHTVEGTLSTAVFEDLNATFSVAFNNDSSLVIDQPLSHLSTAIAFSHSSDLSSFESTNFSAVSEAPQTTQLFEEILSTALVSSSSDDLSLPLSDNLTMFQTSNLISDSFMTDSTVGAELTVSAPMLSTESGFLQPTSTVVGTGSLQSLQLNASEFPLPSLVSDISSTFMENNNATEPLHTSADFTALYTESTILEVTTADITSSYTLQNMSTSDLKTSLLVPTVFESSSIYNISADFSSNPIFYASPGFFNSSTVVSSKMKSVNESSSDFMSLDIQSTPSLFSTQSLATIPILSSSFSLENVSSSLFPSTNIVSVTTEFSLPRTSMASAALNLTTESEILESLNISATALITSEVNISEEATVDFTTFPIELSTLLPLNITPSLDPASATEVSNLSSTMFPRETTSSSGIETVGISVTPTAPIDFSTSTLTLSSIMDASSDIFTSSTILPSASSTTVTTPASSTTTPTPDTTTPSVSTPPTIEGSSNDTQFWVITRIRALPTVNISSQQFLTPIERGLANAYYLARVRRGDIQNGTYVPLTKKRRKRATAADADPNIRVDIVSASRDQSPGGSRTNVDIVHVVEENGQLLTGAQATDQLSLLSDQELAIQIGHVVGLTAEPYVKEEVITSPPDDDDSSSDSKTILIIGSVVGASVFAIVLIIVLCICCCGNRCCCKKTLDDEEEYGQGGGTGGRGKPRGGKVVISDIVQEVAVIGGDGKANRGRKSIAAHEWLTVVLWFRTVVPRAT
ncbi:hypothetical protein PoB_006609900 [Plakobranchus ocellatus]|uniref:Uncharacterized protein n=1 Tax=Plakobranchus ocellatus TaxID=259542 RepID=A0AAV4D5X2_9GAST|nr:hypothetical protein PoB_006609900 [Plakobranchus ocellatus]